MEVLVIMQQIVSSTFLIRNALDFMILRMKLSDPGSLQLRQARKFGPELQGYPDITNSNRPTQGAYSYIQLSLELWEFRRTMVPPEYPAFK